MNLVDIKIENFRGVRSLFLSLDQLTVFIGENNTGKSTVLESVRLLLTHGFRRGSPFTVYDFHLKDEEATPQSAEPIFITLHFAEEQEDEWPDTISQEMNDVVQLEYGLNHIWLRVEGYYNIDSATFETKWVFLDRTGEKLLPGNEMRLVNLLARFAPVFFLSALRNASHEFSQRGQFWSGFLKNIQLPDDERQRIEETLREINESVLNENTGLSEVIKKIADTKQLVSLDSNDPVALETIPTRIFDMVGQIQVHLKSSQGAKLPLNRHGEGTQSLAVLMLFQAFTAANLAEVYDSESKPILALEEPEAHLHPSAIRSLGSILKKITGQILVSSHSGDLISRVPIQSLRRLYKHNGETKVGLVTEDTFTQRELQTIDYDIRLTKGHYLFSRCWLLVEGATEFHLMPLLFSLMGHTQDQVNFSVLEIAQAHRKGDPFIKFAKALGIEWFLMADNDPAGKKYVKRIRKFLEKGENPNDHSRGIAYKDIEHEFWNNGFKDFIQNMLSEDQRRQYNTESDDVAETESLINAAIKRKGGKPAFAQALAEEAGKRGKDSIPETIRDIIARVVHLAGA